MHPTYLLIYFAAVNAVAFALFGFDKKRARADGWRVSENTLLMAALIGGWPGAKFGQRTFRHKTVKQPFVRALNFVPVVWFCLAAISIMTTAPFASQTAGKERHTPRYFSSAFN